MYTPSHFHEPDAAEIARLISAHPLAVLIAQTGAGLVANHIPLMRVKDRLIGHVALANTLHEHVAQGQDVLAVFRGQDTYVSPNWYPSKADTHKAVPTWNYQAVHVTGPIRFSHDAKSKRAAVGLLTKTHETAENGDGAWRMADAPADFMDTMLANIVAFEIDIRDVAAKSKLSQNRTATDAASVIERTEAKGATEMVTRMRALGLGEE